MNRQSLYRILVIDDQAAIHEDYRKILGKQSAASTAAIDRAAAALFGGDPADVIDWDEYDVDSAFQGQQGLDLVQRSLSENRPYALAFVDIRMPPGWDGIETVQRIWEVDPEILIVICSAYSDYSWHEMVRKLGRNDRYLILKKPFDNIEVRQCAMALTERWSVSRTDVLTGLLNRRALRTYLDLEWSRAARYQLPLASAMVDIDSFKRINDTLGHQAGDQVLKAVARRLQAKCRAGDFVCRYGGEEFSVILPHTNEQQAAIWAENARRAIDSEPIFVGERPVRITASFGVAQRLTENDEAERLIERSDRALLEAKALGRNRVVAASSLVAGAAPLGLVRASTAWQEAALAEVMTSPVVSISAEASVADAAALFARFDFSAVPVVDLQGRLVGTIAENDLLGLMASPAAWRSGIENIVRREVASYDEATTLESICEFLAGGVVPRAYILRDGAPIGMVSRRSLLRWAVARRSGSISGRLAEVLRVAEPIDQPAIAAGAHELVALARQLAAAAGTREDAASLFLVIGEIQARAGALLSCGMPTGLPVLSLGEAPSPGVASPLAPHD